MSFLSYVRLSASKVILVSPSQHCSIWVWSFHVEIFPRSQLEIVAVLWEMTDSSFFYSDIISIWLWVGCCNIFSASAFEHCMFHLYSLLFDFLMLMLFVFLILLPEIQITYCSLHLLVSRFAYFYNLSKNGTMLPIFDIWKLRKESYFSICWLKWYSEIWYTSLLHDLRYAWSRVCSTTERIFLL